MQNQNDFSELIVPNSRPTRSILVFFKIIFLPLLIYICALLAYFGVIDFKIELHTIIMMSVILALALIFTRHSAELTYSLFVAQADDFRRNLKNFIVSHLIEIAGEKKSNANFDEFLDDYTRDFRNDNLANIGASVFPMLGILGTFISIAISMPSFSSSSSAQLEKEIGILLNGVGTAFYVSIYGIFLALWWMFFEKIGISKFQNFANRQKEISREFFWQKDELEQRYMSASTAHFDDVRLMISKVSNEKFFSALDDRIEAKFTSLKQLEKLERRIIGEANVSLEQNLQMLSNINSKQDEFIKIHTDILKAISNFSDLLKETELKISTEYNRLNDLTQDKNAALEKNVARMSENLLDLKSSLKEFSFKILNEQNIAINAFRDSLLQGASSFGSVYKKELNSDKSETDRDNLIAKLKKSIDEVEAEANLVIEKIENASLIDED